MSAYMSTRRVKPPAPFSFLSAASSSLRQRPNCTGMVDNALRAYHFAHGRRLFGILERCALPPGASNLWSPQRGDDGLGDPCCRLDGAAHQPMDTENCRYNDFGNCIPCRPVGAGV